MLRAMFGMGGSEILVILIVALLFLGPDKLPEAAKQISKGIRDIKKQSRALQQTIEDDEHIGGAIRDLRSALRGEEISVRPRPVHAKQIEALPPPDPLPAGADAVSLPAPAAGAAAVVAAESEPLHTVSSEGSDLTAASSAAAAAPAADVGRITLPPTAGQPDDTVASAHGDDNDDVAALVKPAPNTIARGAAPTAPPPPPGPSEPEHG